MRVALIGDVHANLPALDAVLRDAREQAVDAIWNVGDAVGYGAFPNEVINELREHAASSIAGNYDNKVLKFPKKHSKWRKRKPAQKFLAFQWAHHSLTRHNLDYLRSLPKEIVVDALDSSVLLTHGSPASSKEHLSPSTPQTRMLELASLVDADLVVCGHSHQPFVRDAAGVRFINPGSVGRPDDGDPRASYAVAEFGGVGDGGVDVRHHRIAYDTARAACAIRELGLPEAFAQMVLQGRDLDGALTSARTWDVAAEEGNGSCENDEDERLSQVWELAEELDHDLFHSQHVTGLALRLFDELYVVHRFGHEERFWLQCAALLHDIGWVEGRRGHHKTTLRLVIERLGSEFSVRERQIIGCVGRHHRGALPKGKHDQFGLLSPIDQYRVTVLGALLRVADGLDRTHRRVVRDLSCQVTHHAIEVACDVVMYPGPEREEALEKGALLERAFDRELVIGWRLA